MAKIDQNDLQYFKEACDKTYATSRGADSNGIVQQQIGGDNVYPKTKPEAITMSNGSNLQEAMDNKLGKTAKAASATTADSAATAIKAIQDASGNVITSTYATKDEIPTDYLTEENVSKYIYSPIINHGTGDTTLAITPNEYHVWGSVSSLTLTLADPSDATLYNEYMFEFVSPSTATTLSLPSDIKWVSAPDIQPNMIYQVSIVNGLGIIGGFSNE